jgi:hypothetical protein
LLVALNGIRALLLLNLLCALLIASSGIALVALSNGICAGICAICAVIAASYPRWYLSSDLSAVAKGSIALIALLARYHISWRGEK